MLPFKPLTNLHPLMRFHRVLKYLSVFSIWSLRSRHDVSHISTVFKKTPVIFPFEDYDPSALLCAASEIYYLRLLPSSSWPVVWLAILLLRVSFLCLLQISFLLPHTRRCSELETSFIHPGCHQPFWTTLSGSNINLQTKPKFRSCVITAKLSYSQKQLRWPFLWVPDDFPCLKRFRWFISFDTHISLSRPPFAFTATWGFSSNSPLVYTCVSPHRFKPSSAFNLCSWRFPLWKQ